MRERTIFLFVRLAANELSELEASRLGDLSRCKPERMELDQRIGPGPRVDRFARLGRRYICGLLS